MSERRVPLRLTAQEAAVMAFKAAGFQPGGSESTISPLRLLVAAQPLIVNEVPQLSRHTAAMFLLAKAGQPVIPSGGSTEQLAGFLYANAGGGWILVNREDPLPRRRFSVAHELGHYMIHFLPLLEAAISTKQEDTLEFGEELSPPDSADEASLGFGRVTLDSAVDLLDEDPLAIEEEANQFAAEVLLPEPICRGLVGEYADQCGSKRQVLTRRLAAEFLVSRQAMERRLRDLQLP